MVSHRLKFAPRFGRDKAHRVAMFRNMVTSLITHERICTTHPKAKYCQRIAERVLALARDGSPASKRLAQPFLQGSYAMAKLFHVLGERYRYRPCGFTRVIHARRREGDNAPLSYLELVDRPGEIRPARICTPQTWQQVQIVQQANTEAQRKTRY